MALTDGLVSYWRLEEVSGTRIDEVSGHDLTDNNTVTSATGKQGTAAQFTRANNEYLSVADHADLSPGDTDWTLQAWVYLDSKPSGSQMRVIDKYQVGAKEYTLLYYQSGDRFEWVVSANGSSDSAYVDANTFGAPSTGTWYCLHAWHDSVNNQIGIAVNAGTADTASHSGGVYNSAAAFEIGRNATSGFHWDGRIDEVALWSRVLSGAERTELYNGGSGLAYSDLGGSSYDWAPIYRLASMKRRKRRLTSH